MGKFITGAIYYSKSINISKQKESASPQSEYAQFVYKDSLGENMVACKKIVEIKSLPLSIYVDKDSKFITTRHKGSRLT